MCVCVCDGFHRFFNDQCAIIYLLQLAQQIFMQQTCARRPIDRLVRIGIAQSMYRVSFTCLPYKFVCTSVCVCGTMKTREIHLNRLIGVNTVLFQLEPLLTLFGMHEMHCNLPIL